METSLSSSSDGCTKSRVGKSYPRMSSCSRVAWVHVLSCALGSWAWQKEGECTAAILCLKLSSIDEKLKQTGSSEISLNSMVLKEGETEANNSNNGTISSIKPNKSKEMVLKEGTKHAMVLKEREMVE